MHAYVIKAPSVPTCEAKKAFWMKASLKMKTAKNTNQLKQALTPILTDMPEWKQF